MSTNTATTASLSDGSWPNFPDLEPDATERRFPRLQAVRARGVAQDRWERLVTEIEIPTTPLVVWRALTAPDAIRNWLAVCRGPIAEVGQDFMLDFEDGEFFYCHTEQADSPTSNGHAVLRYLWRWVGVGPATRVTWTLSPGEEGSTHLVVVEEALNPPSDWRAWNGGGWPGVLDQLAAHIRTGTTWRWPWRRMGPYVQIELPASPYDGWDRLTRPESLRFWLQRRYGSFTSGEKMTLVMGDASGMIEMAIHRVAEPNQEFPSFLPWMVFGLRRAAWPVELGGKLYIEPTSLGNSLLQIFVDNWENLAPDVQRAERPIIAGFFRDAMVRAQSLFAPEREPSRPHGWS